MNANVQALSRESILSPKAASNAASQATTIEQSRAIAEVQAAVVVAQQVPRSEAMALKRADDTCGMTEVAERAFFKFPRGGQTVSGPSVHLARELARCWGNIKHGLRELNRDDDAGRSEMLAYAWDVETNTRAETSFIVPHKRDKKGGPEALIDMRDIYENNANAGARRLREMIFAVLPPYLIERAKEKCMETLRKGGGRPLPEQRADTIGAFEKIGIARHRLESKLGKADAWTEIDIANLRVSYQSIKRGEITAAEEFPDESAATMTAEVKALAAAKTEKQETTETPAGVVGTEPAASPATEPAEAAPAPADDDGWEAWWSVKRQAIEQAMTLRELDVIREAAVATWEDDPPPEGLRLEFNDAWQKRAKAVLPQKPTTPKKERA